MIWRVLYHNPHVRRNTFRSELSVPYNTFRSESHNALHTFRSELPFNVADSEVADAV